MSAWLLLAMAWLAGVALQTQTAVLWSPLACGLGALACCGALALARAMSPRLRVPMWRACLPITVAVFAMAGLAWTSTAWRANLRMAEQIPPAWRGLTVPVLVQVEGLPRASSADALFDARVLKWWPDAAGKAGTAGEGGGALGCEAPCRPPAMLAVRMRTPDGALPRAGQRWLLHVRLHEPDGPSNPGGHDPTLSYFERGVRAMARVPAKAPPPLKLRDKPPWPWDGWIDRLRQDTRDRIFALVADKRAAGVLAGLSVGDQSAIERGDWDVFRKAGLGHVVSISGTHIAMLGWLAAWLVRRLWSRWHGGMHAWPASDAAMWAGVAFSIFYALLAGWGVPAQRTVWMMAIVAWMRASGRRWPWPLVWAGSAAILTALDPWCLRQPGFWLSYVAVGVLMSAGMSSEGLPGKRGDGDEANTGTDTDWRSLLSRHSGRAFDAARAAAAEMTQSQWLVTKALLPLILVCFGQISLIGFGANLFAIPFFTLGITPLALTGVLIEPCWTFGAWLIQLVMDVLEVMAELPFATHDWPDFPFWLAVPLVLAGWSIALRIDITWRLALLPFALVLLYLPQGLRVLPPPDEGHFQLLSVDIGQGTAVFVRTQRHTLLFDTGARVGTDNNAGDRILLPLMRALGVKALDALFISHEDIDHVGGAEAVVSQLPVAHLHTSLAASHPLRTMHGVDGRAVPHTACEAGQSWVWDGVRFDVLHPGQGDLARRAAEPRRIAPNAVSCVLRVRAKARLPTDGKARGDPDEAPPSALLTGDIGKTEEAAILSRAGLENDDKALRTTVLISPHHGSKTSSSEGFLHALHPRQVIIQAGRRNAYGHPAEEVIARYEVLGLPWVSTPGCGAHVWYSDEAPRLAGTGESSGPAQAAVGRCWRRDHHRYWHGP